MMNAVRASPTRSELTLGLGLRVVRVLVGQQPSLRFRQHHGNQVHATCLSLPAAPPKDLAAEPAAAKRAGRWT